MRTTADAIGNRPCRAKRFQVYLDSISSTVRRADLSWARMTTFSEFSTHRRTAAILIGEGTSAAYLAGVMSALKTAGVRVDMVIGKGAGALVAVFSSIDAEGRLHGDAGLLAQASGKRPWRLRPLYKMTLACLLVALAAFLSPVLFGLAAVLALPLQALGRLLLGALEPGLAGGSQWLPALFEAAGPVYLRAMVIPLVALCTIWVTWWLSSFTRQRGAPSLPELYDLEPLAALVETKLWQAVRGASTGDRPRERRDIGGAYQELLSGSLGQLGFRELVFYALDTDSGREVTFALLKDRFLKKFSSNGAGRARHRETIDLAKDGGPLLFDALMAALSPVGLVPNVPIKLPLDTDFGGEVHRFAGSLLSGSSAVQDAVAAGAEQIIYVAGCAPSERPGGNAIERLIEASVRRVLSDDLVEATRQNDLPVFLIRPDKQRLNAFEVTGRAQIGNERLDLNALIAHGHRDALRLFVEPVLSDDAAEHNRSSMKVPQAGPREL